ncbi:MAG: NADH-quinone oxidoreductase subunit NuoH [Pseudomonadota bacterium]|nr:NADH-quinone oxidoreductase subunit NuoH [Pseudomonadota bacterium]
MGGDAFEVTVNLVKMAVIFLMMVQMVPILVWAERRGSAFIQNRFGPNRVGPLGLTQLLADAVKFIMKEEFVPGKATALLFYAAPVVALIPAALSLAAIPYSVPVHVEAFGEYGPYVFNIQGYEAGLGILFILSVSSLGAYSILMAGYGSANKYSLMGALRASAQMVSYELALSLSVIGVVLIYGTLNLSEIIKLQEGVKFGLPNWGILYQPLGFVLFFSCAFAECNRLPFDLSEAEGELVAGFHTEYGGFKMLLFFMGEYGHMMVASCLATIFYFGGYNIPYCTPTEVLQILETKFASSTVASLLTSLVFLISFLIKVGFFLWLFIWVRWTLPRFRYDQLMNLGWKKMLPWSLFNLILTAAAMLILKG